jgi:hypothetical protein
LKSSALASVSYFCRQFLSGGRASADPLESYLCFSTQEVGV